MSRANIGLDAAIKALEKLEQKKVELEVEIQWTEMRVRGSRDGKEDVEWLKVKLSAR
jgi:hypothetical protein